MQSEGGLSAVIVRILSPFIYVIQDTSTRQLIRIALAGGSQQCYQHLLLRMVEQPVTYTLQKKSKLREDERKGVLYLSNVDITLLYTAEEVNQPACELKCIESTSNLEKQEATTLICLVRKVECLKFQLIVLQRQNSNHSGNKSNSNLNQFKNPLNSSQHQITFYFSELKLIRLSSSHPKQQWQRAHHHFKSLFQGMFVQLHIAGKQKYKEETNVFGQIYALSSKQDIKQKLIESGYACPSANANKYISEQRIAKFQKLAEEAKTSQRGIYQKQKKMAKASNQVTEIKYKQWQSYVKEIKSINQVREEEEQKNILEELQKQVGNKAQYSKIKILTQVIMVLYDGTHTNPSNLSQIRFLSECAKVSTTLLLHCQNSFYGNIANMDYLKLICRLIIFDTFYLESLEKSMEGEHQNKNKPTKIIEAEAGQFQKIIKFLFKLCFLGNETFHDKLFGKRKQLDYENFSFQSVYLNGGISSVSQCSDADQSDQKQDKKDRKLNSAHQKLRVNSISLLALILKLFPSVVQSSWEICVTPNILTLDFLEYLRKLKINAEATQLTSADKGEIVNLMRANFGDHSLILLSVFEKNWRVRLSAVQCIGNMISNFQGKKLIDTTQSAYMEKLLKETRSSFVPRSFIIFSGLRNALYFLLFSLHHEKNINIIMEVFKTLSSLCHNCTLVDKMAFEDGVGLLMENYIEPVLAFDWMIPELEELKSLCISFLAVLVNTHKKWDQIQQLYLLNPDQTNINRQLLTVLAQRIKSSKPISDRIITEILTYFTKLPKRYYRSVFYKCMGDSSIWTYTCEIFQKQINLTFAAFVEEIFKCHFDQKLKNQQQKQAQVNFIPQNRSLNKITPIKDEELGIFLSSFLPFYSQQVNSQLYIHLINILTFIDYDQWSKPEFKEGKKFLLHCFNGLISEKKEESKVEAKTQINAQIIKQRQQYPSIDLIKNNSLMKLTLIKMVGYMSFCNEFHSADYIEKSVKVLLEASKHQKSLNSIVKISWGLSNWSKVKLFADSLTDTQLEQCIGYLMLHSESDKEKIASNCTRGIGFFVANVNPQKYDLFKCRLSIIKNLSHQILKVRTNSTKTLISILEFSQLSKQGVTDLIPILQQNLLKNNYNLQMQTLNLLHKLSNPIKPKRFLNIYLTILRNLLNHTTMQYEFSQIKTIKDLRKTIIGQIFEMENEMIIEVNKDLLASIYAYFGDCMEENKKYQAKMPERQFQKSEEAQKLIFNLKKEEFYDQEKTIITKAGVGLSFDASPSNLELIKRIRSFSATQLNKISSTWTPLATMRIQESNIDIQEYVGEAVQ